MNGVTTAMGVVTEGQPAWVNVIAFGAVLVGIVLIVILNWRMISKRAKPGQNPPSSAQDPSRDDEPRA